MPTRSLSLALLSGGSLALEICLTRLLSAVYYPPVAFTALALAVLGIGLGAALSTLRSALRDDTRTPQWSALAGASAVVTTVAVSLATSIRLFPLLVILLVATYTFVGLAITAFFANRVDRSPQLYTTDLVGAGLGAAVAIPLMDAIGPLNGALTVGFVLALAGYNMSRVRLPVLETVSLLLAFLVLATNVVGDWLRFDYGASDTDKPIASVLSSGGTTVQTMWDSFARTDLVQPGDGRPLQVYMDGAAGSVMPSAMSLDLIRTDIGFFAFAITEPQSVMAIGPGGGLDVWFALQSGADDIVGVEVNPASVALVQDYAAYNGGLYDKANVRVVVDEGRSVLRREARLYDLISLSQVVTLAAEYGGYALTENTIYTVEAFRDYLDHLTERGVVAIKLYDEITLTRALATALAALVHSGLSDAEAIRHTAVFLDANANPPIPLLIVRRTPFTREDSAVQAALARELGYVPLYLADAVAQPPLDAVENGQLTFAEIVAQSDRDISAPTDNRPFFFQFEHGLPSALTPLLVGLGAVVLIGGVWIAIAQRALEPRMARLAPLYFAALGAGFIAIEIALIQQIRLFLGHPTLAITAVLSALLIGGGAGSLLAGRVVRRPRAWIGGAVAGYVILWLVAWPPLSDALRAAPTVTRLVAVVIALIPLALVMGMPFPLGLSGVGQIGPQHVALAWTVNGVLTVIGSVGSVAVAILVGYPGVLGIGFGCYVLVALLAPVIFRPTTR